MADPFLDCVHLPFNFSTIKDDFIGLHGCPTDEYPPETIWAIMQEGSILLRTQDGSSTLPSGMLPEEIRVPENPLAIGIWHGKTVRTFQLHPSVVLPPEYRAEPFNASSDKLDSPLLTLAGLARQILHWERMSRYCSRCGATTLPLNGSWGKKCSDCGYEHFPHIHPCAIVLVRRGDELLLTRKAEWIPGRYSLVAGFLDFGESLEECAAREVLEETGITVSNISYRGSQSWPFPSQLMAGFVADYVSGDIKVDTSELEDARWFPVSSLPLLPAKRSIARWLIDSCI